MRAKLVVVFALAALSSCAGARDRETCTTDWGLEPGTPAFGQCLVSLGELRVMRSQAAAANFAASAANFNAMKGTSVMPYVYQRQP